MQGGEVGPLVVAKLTCGAVAIMSAALVACVPWRGSANDEDALGLSRSHRLPSESAKTIELLPGTTSVIAEGKLSATRSAEYVFGAVKGSLVMAHVLAPKTNLDLAVYRMDTGQIVNDEYPYLEFWKGHMPATLGYLFEVRSINRELEYSLEIEVPRALFMDESSRSVRVASWAPPSVPIAYFIPRTAGRTLTADLEGPPGSYLNILGLEDGQKLLAAAVNARMFKGRLSGDQDYILRVYPGERGGDFILKATVSWKEPLDARLFPDLRDADGYLNAVRSK